MSHAWLEVGECGEDASCEVVVVCCEAFGCFFESYGVVVFFELFFDEFDFWWGPADSAEDALEFDGVAVSFESVDDVDVVVFG